MDISLRKELLKEQLEILQAACKVLRESYDRTLPLLGKDQSDLSIAEKESCEALTSRFARLCDFLFQRVFRTLDQIELSDEGSAIDRLNRMEKRGLIKSAELWRKLRELRNQIAHEYLIETSDSVLHESHQHSPELFATVDAVLNYVALKKLC